MTRNEISEKTGFDFGETFSNKTEVKIYFTVNSMEQMYGSNLKNDFPELVDQNVLDEMAETVINNKWHMK